MRWLDRLARKLRPFAVPNVTLVLIFGQVLVYVATQSNRELLDNTLLIPERVLQGEFWRLVTFLFVPPDTSAIFAFIFWYLFYLMGTALENTWGVFRYNLFLLIGFAATTAVAFLYPALPASNGFVQGSVFLAFAFLFPDFVLHLFFILPVKIKWLALIAWLGYLHTLVMGLWPVKLFVLASVCNFLLFFGKDLMHRIRHGRRRMAWKSKATSNQIKPRHQCVVCGITNLTHPKMQFRYCTKCDGQCGYCTEHLQDHEHVTAEAETGKVH